MANNKMNVEGKNYSDIPVWRRYTLTIEEAARYYHIGEGKLRTLIDTPVSYTHLTLPTILLV